MLQHYFLNVNKVFFTIREPLVLYMQPKSLKQSNSLALSRLNDFDEGILEALHKGVFFHRRYPMSSSKNTMQETLDVCVPKPSGWTTEFSVISQTTSIMHGLERIPEVTFFARGDTLRRGHTSNIYKERSKREPRRNFFSQRVVIPWNALPEKVVCSKSTLQFKIE